MSDLVKQQTQVQTKELNLSMEDIKKLICPQASDLEIEVFHRKCHALNLNPFLNEIYLVKYGSQKAQHIVNYLTYIQRGEQTGLLDGYKVDISDDAEYSEITIWRKDWSHPFSKKIWKKEFDKGQSVWKEKPIYMLEKVAIACGFRQCFTLSDLPYTQEEIQSMQNEKNIDRETPMFTKNEQSENVEQLKYEVEKVEAEIVQEPKSADDIINELKESNPEKFDKFCESKKWDSNNIGANVKNHIAKYPEKFIDALESFEA